MRASVSLALLLPILGSLAAAANPANLPLGRVPEEARGRSNPLASDPDSVAAGGKLYERHCVHCHGLLGRGSRKGPALDTPQARTAPPGALFWVLTHGSVRRGMPVWTKLPEPQRWQIVSYLETLGERAGPTMP